MLAAKLLLNAIGLADVQRMDKRQASVYFNADGFISDHP